MSMTGAIVNALAIVAGGAVGLLFRRGIPERVSKTVMIGLGLCVLYIGIRTVPLPCAMFRRAGISIMNGSGSRMSRIPALFWKRSILRNLSATAILWWIWAALSM